MEKARKTAPAALAMSLLLLFGCAAPQTSSPAAEAETVTVMASVPVKAPEPAPAPEPEPLPEIVGGITFAETLSEDLNAQQLALIEEYFYLYYMSLADLTPLDPAALFCEEPMGQVQAYLHLTTFDVLTCVRAMQPQDLTLTRVEYDIVVDEIIPRETGELMVKLRESNTMNFSYLPEVDAETVNMPHAFYMKETEDGWKLTRHWQNEDFHFLVSDLLLPEQPRNWQGYSDVDGCIALLDEIRDRILLEAEDNIDGRPAQAQRTAEAPAMPSRSYDREAALSYADEWIGKRNPYWPEYDDYGGNCNNYASQTLYAGGIPMDVSGPLTLQWKWCGDHLNETQALVGRSSSWSGVGEFYIYLEHNRWYGPVADLGAGYYEGQPGDLLQFGALEDWKHTVVISEVITDENGEVIDYLIHSNTADRRNFPAMAYVYTDHRLIHVLGWNG